MNNRYIFRGKREDNGQWIYGDLIIDQYSKHYIHPNTNAFSVNEYNLAKCIQMIEVIPETVGQCTGLKDKNGKLIFEGDIVIDKYSCETFGFVGAVIYNAELTQFQIFSKHQPQYVVNLGSRRDSTRILGNIYDDKDLLERSDTE